MRQTSDITSNSSAPVRSFLDSSILSPISWVVRRLTPGVSRVGKRLEVGANRQVSKLLRRLASDNATVALSDIEAPRKVLLIRPNFRMGNLLLATPALNAVRTALPGVTTGLLTTSSYADLLDGHPDIDRLYLIDRNMLIRPDRVWRLLRKIRLEGYDLAIDCASGSSLLSGACAILSGARYRLAPSGKSQSHLFNVHGVSPAGPIHVIDETLALLDQAAIPARTRDMMIHVADADRQWALSRLAEHATPGAHVRVGVNIGARGSKRWPIEHFLDVIRELDRKGCSVIVFAGPQELDRLNELTGALPDSVVVDTTSEPRRFAALLQTCSLFVTCDTGPMHLAVAVGTPTLAIFVRDNADRFGPIGPRHRVLYAEGGVTATMVLETIDTMSLSFIEK